MLVWHLRYILTGSTGPELRGDDVVDQLRREFPLSSAGEVLSVDVSSHQGAPFVEDTETPERKLLSEESETNAVRPLDVPHRS